MSGHSKWSQIKRQKGVADSKRGQIFTKLANAIIVAARSGGTNPDTNFRLRLSIEEARKNNMPKENIERAIKKAAGGGEGGSILETTYEGYGPGGVAVIIEAVTDNKMRTTQEIRSVLERSGGSLAGPGSVIWMFERVGQLEVPLEDTLDPDHVLLAAAEVGGDDVDVEDNIALVYTKPELMEAVKEGLEGHHLKVQNWELTARPNRIIKVTDEKTAVSVISLVRKLEDLQDVQKVYSNFDIPDEILQKSSI